MPLEVLGHGWDECQLARFSERPCSGRLIRAHLLPRQLLRRDGIAAAIEDPRSYVVACGGPMGNAGHHGEFDSGALVVPRAAVPLGTEQLAVELGLGWYLDRRFGIHDWSERG